MTNFREPCLNVSGLGTARADLPAIAALRKSLPAWAPSDTPGRRLKEIVTDGSCPVWLTVSGPASVVTFTTVSRGIRLPADERTYNIESAFGLKANGSVSLIGINGVTATIQSATIVLDQSTSTVANGTAPGIDFKASYPDPNTPGLSIDTGSGTPVLLDMTGTQFSASGDITLSIGQFF